MIAGVILQIVQGTQTLADTALQAANTLTQQPQPSEIKLSVWELALKGGPVMIPIAILSLLAIYIFVERFFVISKASKEDNNFMNNIRDFMQRPT